MSDKETLLKIVDAIENLNENVQLGFRRLEGKVDEGLKGTNSRLDQVIENTGGHYRSLERRVTVIEEKLKPGQAG